MTPQLMPLVRSQTIDVLVSIGTKEFSDDPLYLVRIYNLGQFAEIVADVQEQSGKTLRETIALVDSKKSLVLGKYPFIEKAYAAIVKHFGIQG